MGRVRKCDHICHNAKGHRCRCVCGGHFHSAAGAVNREALRTVSEEARQKLLKEHGFKSGEAVYIEQLPLMPER